MSRRRRVYYVGMITTDAYGHVVGERVYSGAATRKMLLVAQAMRCVGLRAIVVSLPFVGAKARRASFPSVVISQGGVPMVFTATLRSTLFRKLIGPIFLLLFLLRHCQRGDSVIFYNHAVEYLPALMALRLRGVKLMQDIEDAPIGDERGLSGFLNRVSFDLTSRLTAARKMVVADHVAHILGLDDFVTIRGVAAREICLKPTTNNSKWLELKSGGALKLHYGGTLITETGVALFCEAVDRLAQHADILERPVRFNITGVGDLYKIRALQDRLREVGVVEVEVFPELNKAEYLELLDACHGSLSLKQPGSAMGTTTFPSKVLEITGAGLALVTARLGDVAKIFVDDTAFFLPTCNSESLANTVVIMASDPIRVETVAAAGRARCHELFSPEAVGIEMRRLLCD